MNAYSPSPPLPFAFFDRPTLEVAHDLLGKYLLRRRGEELVALRINEVEAYDGFEDRASHAFRGKTPRNRVMFGPAGYWYVYRIYGIHWMLNIVTGSEGYPAAVLIRGAGEQIRPGRLTRALAIDADLNTKRAIPESGLWIESSEDLSSFTIVRTPRIGVEYAGPLWSKKPYRLVLKKN